MGIPMGNVNGKAGGIGSTAPKQIHFGDADGDEH
jgi:hypothetical protein